jgi:hypothetical protein
VKGLIVPAAEDGSLRIESCGYWERLKGSLWLWWKKKLFSFETFSTLKS